MQDLGENYKMAKVGDHIVEWSSTRVSQCVL